jgi:hypothetical protein
LLVIVAQKSSGKSELLKELSRTLYDAGRRAEEEFAALEDKAAAQIEDLRAELARNRGRLGQRGEEIRSRIRRLESIRGLNLVIGNATPEALKRTVGESTDHFSHLQAAEGADVLDIAHGRYNDDGSSNISCFLSLKSGDHLNDVRIKRDSVTVHCGYISMLLMIQGIVADRMLKNEDDLVRGLFPRMYFIDSKFVRRELQKKEPSVKPSRNLFEEKNALLFE